jgi:ABC-type transport system substrate-binding protein
MRSIRTRFEALTPATLAACGAALVAVPLGCGPSLSAPLPAAHPEDPTPRRGGSLHLASYVDVRNLDPAGPLDGVGQEVVELIFSGLVDYDAHAGLVPDLADHWEVEDDGRAYRFVLRQGVQMQDGEELTAADVKRSVERSLHPSAPNPASSNFDNLVGYDAFVSRKAEHLDGVVVEGRYVVTFHLTKPDAAFLPMLAMHTLRPVCKTGGDRYVDTWIPCGAGPFRLDRGGWQRGTSLRLVRHEGYFRPGLPYLDAIEWTYNMGLVAQRFRFEDGDLDMVSNPVQSDADRFMADPRWKHYAAIGGDNAVWGEAMNTRMPPFDNVEVRRAVAAAIQREHYSLLKGANMSPATQLLPRSVPGFDPTLEGQRYDYAAALEHMRKAGYPYDPATGKGGWPFPIVYTLAESSLMFQTAQLLQQDLAKIGLRLQLRLVNYSAYLALTQRPGSSAMHAQGWGLDYADPSTFFDPLFTTSAIAGDESYNTSFYSNPRYDDLVERARRELDPAARKALYRTANAILSDEAPWAFEYTVHTLDVRQPYVRGYLPHPIWPRDVGAVWLDRENPGAARILGGGLR